MDNNDLLDISVAVARSNPLVMRMVRIPAVKDIGDLMALSCISLGLEPRDGEFILDRDSEEVPGADWPLGQYLKPGDSGRLVLRDGSNRHQLVLFLDVKDCLHSKKHNRDEIEPSVLMAIGYDLPKDSLDIGEINYGQESIRSGSSFQTEAGSFYSPASLEFKERRTGNAILKFFAPEKAQKELNRNLGMPMHPLLETLKNSDLKDIASYYGVYYDSGMRKADLVSALCYKYSGEYLEEVFDDMDLSEYLSFKEFVFSEELQDDGNKYLKSLPSLYYRGLLNDISKTGIRIASEVLDYYDNWQGTEREEDFIYEKQMKTALCCCRNLYGIFSTAAFKAVLKTSAGDGFPMEKVEGYLKKRVLNSLLATRKNKISSLSLDVYYSSELTKMEAKNLYSKQNHGPDAWYHPTKEEIAVYAGEGVRFSAKGTEKLLKLLEEYGDYYSGYDDDRKGSAVRSIVSSLHKEGDVNKAMDAAIRLMYRLRWSNSQTAGKNKLMAIFNSELPTLPLIALNGYSKSNAKNVIKWKDGAGTKGGKKK
ncbi:MAG: hypothetical protein J6O55_06480 [Lachnospiraceae bacterium]|nr:hypothetical protein [Lachnospiraceae bacterium]